MLHVLSHQSPASPLPVRNRSAHLLLWGVSTETHRRTQQFCNYFLCSTVREEKICVVAETRTATPGRDALASFPLAKFPRTLPHRGHQRKDVCGPAGPVIARQVSYHLPMDQTHVV